jgi:hypothetical protein
MGLDGKRNLNLWKLKELSDIAKRAKVRNERPVMAMNLFSQEIRIFRSASDAGRNGFNATAVHSSCKKFRRVHRGFVWVFADEPNPQSLLEEKRMGYLKNPPKVGPKSWL